MPGRLSRKLVRQIRLARVDEGMGVVEISRTFGIHRNTASKYLKNAEHELDALVSPASALDVKDVEWVKGMRAVEPRHIELLLEMLRQRECPHCGEATPYLVGMKFPRCASCRRRFELP